MPAKRKTTKRKASVNLNKQIMFIGGQAYKLEKIPKTQLKKAVGEDNIREGGLTVGAGVVSEILE